MEPFTLFLIAAAGGFLTLGGLKLLPKIHEHQEFLAKQARAIEQFASSNGFRFEKPRTGDLRWIMHGPGWQLIFDSNSSSDSGTASLLFKSDSNVNQDSTFFVLTEPGIKALNHPMARRVIASASKVTSRHSKHREDLDFQEVFAILDRNNTIPFGQTAKNKLLLAASSHHVLNKIRASNVQELATAVAKLDTGPLIDGTAQIARLKSHLQVRIQVGSPTLEQVKTSIKLGEAILRLPS